MNNNTIWKFTLELKNDQEVIMPSGAKILSVGNQNDAVCVWAEVNKDALKIIRKFSIRGTGHKLTGKEGTLIGTVLGVAEILVWHVYVDENMYPVKTEEEK